MTCTADGPWGLQGMIEGVMIEQSMTSVKQYLDFCISRCTTLLTEQVTNSLKRNRIQLLLRCRRLTSDVHALQRLAAGEVIDSPRSDDTTFDQFFDARENFSRTTSTASSFGATLTIIHVPRHCLLPARRLTGGPFCAGGADTVDTVALMQLLDSLEGRYGVANHLLLSSLPAMLLKRAHVGEGVGLLTGACVCFRPRWFGWLCGDGRRLDGVQTWAAVG